MLKTACGPNGSYDQGREYVISQDLALKWASIGVCELLSEPVAESIVETSIIEPEATREEIASNDKVSRNRRNGRK